eukprot:CAMPEP_0204898392 /NCGR_PEP_ID=MMETSP1397-20131031/1265_1 /ASSEMBLY_ACC=CAM_ASM_000891 /TAXON_ID=49980 /ORGANISM="Climacostomum Climacostomum virens, Strain Stock W-24" /LENGTH=118 /DNA_ID=CAMNT_0052066237 /DNA_START=89 /DNA_END=441 /DNA_ORIENTATION=+
MGCSVSHSRILELSAEARELAIEIFREIDENRSGAIDQQETTRWWQNRRFAKLTAKAMFDAVDVDKNGEIDLKEWLAYWTQVKASGVPDEDIIEELTNIKKKKPWVGFADCSKLTVST